MIETLAQPTQVTRNDRIGKYLKTRRLRQQAAAVLENLLAAKAECEHAMARANRADAVKTVTGASSLERTISSTRQTIDQLDRALASARGILEPEELEVVESA